MLSLWPFRYFVVLCTTMSAPNSIGRCTARAGERVVDDQPGAVPVRELGGARRGRSAACTGLVGVSTNSIFVFGAHRPLDQRRGRDVST